jgi:hypothetical protein
MGGGQLHDHSRSAKWRARPADFLEAEKQGSNKFI